MKGASILGLGVVLAALASAAASPLGAQEAAEGVERSDTTVDAGAEIVVSGLRNPFRLTSKQLRAMHKAFVDNRGRYAPGAAWDLRITSPIDGRLNDMPRLSIVSRDDSIPIAYDPASRSFRFPAGLRIPKDAELVSNWRGGALSLLPFVHSPGTSETDRLVGDLRLQCEVMWAGVKFDLSFVERTAFGAAGGCQSSRVSFYFRTERPLASASVTHSGRSDEVRIKEDRMGFRPPIFDKAIPNSARLRLIYR